MNIKWIAMDMDGTLTTSEKTITPYTQEVLKKAQEKGFKLILASGRPTAGLFREAKLLNLESYDGYLLSFNGAHICSAKTNETFHAQTVEEALAKRVIEEARKRNLDITLHKGNEILIERENAYKVDYEAHACNMEIRVVDDLTQVLDFNLHKLLLSANPDHIQEHLAELQDVFKDELSIYLSAPFYIEVVPKGIDKGASIAKLAQLHGVDASEIIAFGDERNDLTMLEYVGHGVAMGNALDEVKAIANEVTDTNDEDGVAKTLERILAL